MCSHFKRGFVKKFPQPTFPGWTTIVLLFDITFCARETNTFFYPAGRFNDIFYFILWWKIRSNAYLSSYSHHQNSQGHMYTCKIQRYCYKLHLHDKVGRSCTRRYLRWLKTKRMDFTVFFKYMHFTFLCENTVNIHLLLWYYKHYVVLKDKSLSNRTRWFYILMGITTSSCLSLSTRR